jgi:hypothetical protein
MILLPYNKQSRFSLLSEITVANGNNQFGHKGYFDIQAENITDF